VIDYSKEVVSALNLVLPTHHEMALTSKTETPCISYMELNNYAATETIGATLGYSYISYQVKVWSNKVADLQGYSLEIDNALRPLGFKRISSGILYDNESTMMQKILTYEALASEEFQGGK
jgi:hypothetical protein